MGIDFCQLTQCSLLITLLGLSFIESYHSLEGDHLSEEQELLSDQGALFLSSSKSTAKAYWKIWYELDILALSWKEAMKVSALDWRLFPVTECPDRVFPRCSAPMEKVITTSPKNAFLYLSGSTCIIFYVFPIAICLITILAHVPC